LLVLALLLDGCSNVEALRPREHLDRRTGATLQIAAEPWIFAREQPQLAVNARDYLTVYPLRVNVGGRLAHYLAVFEWSTVDRRVAAPEPDDAAFELLLDDRRVPLRGGGATLRDAGIADWPLPPPGRGARLHVYAVEESMLRYWGAATLVRVRKGGDASDPDARFDAWRDGRAALVAFLAGGQ
jgi:hypothetical protein